MIARLWTLTGFFTALVAGMVLSHALHLARLEDWLLTNKREDVLDGPLTHFIVDVDPGAEIRALMLCQLALAAVTIVVAWLGRKQAAMTWPGLVGLGMAFLSFPIMIALFAYTAHAELEAAIRAPGDVPEPIRQRWLSVNVPVSTAAAVAYLAAALLMLWSPPQTQRVED